MTDSSHAPVSRPAGEDAFRNTSRGEYVFRSLRDAIQEGRYRQGERLREEEIARSLGVSRTPVREALGRLQARGLVEMAAGRGLVVAELTKQQVLELYAMREILEGAAARFAAQHASPSETAALRRLAEECRDADTAAGMARVNRRFHQAIYDAAHNRYLHLGLSDLGDALTLLRSTTFTAPGRSASAYDEHLAITMAIERHDADAAEEAARHHIREAQRLRLEMLFEL